VFEEELKRLSGEGLLRRVLDRASAQGARVSVEGREMVNFASNDYLGLAAHPALAEAARRAIEKFGLGSGASRLLAGGSALHAELEARTAEFKGTEAALLFNSGYSANTGSIAALAGEGDAAFSDELNHASLVDGCRLSKAKTFVYNHADAGHLEGLLKETKARRRVVATDSVFSMDGDIAPLEDIYELCLKHGAILYIDDAHATGVLGGGRGSLAHFSLRPEPWAVQMGTYSKALGSFGAFAAGDGGAISWLLNSARSLIYSTALPACVAAASLAALEIVENDPTRIERLWKNRERLFSGLKALGLDTGASETPIIPIIMKSVPEALELSGRLRREGVFAPAIRPPTVREPRLRLSVTAAHSAEDIERLIEALGRAG
jgi:8-amino-7-oxononanoate synthase